MKFQRLFWVALILVGGVTLVWISFRSPKSARTAAMSPIVQESQAIPLPEEKMEILQTIPPIPDQKKWTRADFLAGLLEGKGNYEFRNQCLEALKGPLSTEERARFCQFLLTTDEPSSISAKERWPLKNDMMNLLRSQEPPVAGLTLIFSQIFRNSKQDEVMRAYALQHLSAWYEQVNESQRPEINDVMWEGVHSKLDSCPGTALLGLCHMSSHSSINPREIGVEAVKIATDPQSHLSSRTTAIVICGELGYKDALPAAREIARSNENISFRAAAIACLGLLGDSTETAFLKQTALSEDVRLRLAAQTALTRLTHQPLLKDRRS